MATVHLGRMQGPAGFGKTVAVKRLHPHVAKDPDFAKMFIDEARLTAGLTHPNIVMTLDVLEEEDGLYLVMEYVHGVSLTQLDRKLDKFAKIPIPITCAIISAALDGLHAAHTATDEHGAPLGIVHRDVSPQNILIGFNGITKIADFGVAKAAGRLSSTGDGATKGKISYMAPEQVRSEQVTPRTDVFSAGIVLWECLTRRKLVEGNDGPSRLRALLELQVVPPSTYAPDIPPALDSIVMCALDADPNQRFAGAKEMALALQSSVELARDTEIANYLRVMLPGVVADRDRVLAEFQRMVATEAATPTHPNQFYPTPTPPSSSPMAVARPSPRSHVATEVIPGGIPNRSSAAPASQADTSAGNVSINEYLRTGQRPPAPSSMPKGVLAALIVLPLLGITGAGLVVMTVKNKPRPLVTATPPPPSATAEPVPVPMPVPASAEPEPEPAPSDSEAEPGVAPSASIAPPAVVTVHPRSTATATPVARPAASASKKCRIVAKPDASGRMKFEEVCGP